MGFYRFSTGIKAQNPKQKGLVDSLGWPLPSPNLRIKISTLSERIKTDFAQLEARDLSDDKEAANDFERLLKTFGDKHQHLMRGRAKAGDKSFYGFSSIQELLWLADDTIECLAWLAKYRSEDCKRHAERRLNWPGFISVLASITGSRKRLLNTFRLDESSITTTAGKQKRILYFALLVLPLAM